MDDQVIEELFERFCRTATRSERCPEGFGPYPYQSQLAVNGLPDLLEVSTGAGKTLAAVLPWLFRRRLHPDPGVRARTPRRLVMVLPQRSLVEQARGKVREWTGALSDAPPVPGWTAVGVHVLMGGSSTDDRRWKLAPAEDSVLVGTQDMVLSRLLMRGYGESRRAWPVAFGLLHSGSQFVFDEVQLMGPGLVTSLQLEGLRRVLGGAEPSASMWMSATVRPDDFDTAPDLPGFLASATHVTLGKDDRTSPLRTRLGATRTVARLSAGTGAAYAKDLARFVLEQHRAGSRTIVVANTVGRAVSVYDEICRGNRTRGLEVVLLHSRFRPPEREARMDRALEPPTGPGTIVVTTQVLEAGIDVTSALLVSELAPWSSMVQRAGRCNRDGGEQQARLVWVRPSGRDAERPYGIAELDNAEARLVELEGRRVTTGRLCEITVEDPPPLHAVLRRRDLLDLFDTSPDLSGNDIDVSRWIRDRDERTVSVAWRDLGGTAPGKDTPALRREELCPVPLADLRELLRHHHEHGRSTVAWVQDWTDREWILWTSAVRPGATVLLDATAGGYSTLTGWHGRADAEVPSVPLDPVPTTAKRSSVPVTLRRHLQDVQGEVAAVLDDFGPLPGLSPSMRAAAVAAGALHDLGKAHPVFVESLRRAGAPADGGPWAKSGTDVRLRHSRPGFRHELASALMMLDDGTGLLDGIREADLTTYLVAAHHGVMRLAPRSLPDDTAGTVLGIEEGDEIPGSILPDGRSVPAVVLSPRLLQAAPAGGGRSWIRTACALRDRADLGPFRLAFLEAAVRSADWRASSRYDVTESVDGSSAERVGSPEEAR